jgi:hypothetical protein
MKWLLSLLMLAPVAFFFWLYWVLRASGDSGFGSAWLPAYRAPEWAVGLAMAVFGAALVGLVQGPRRRRVVRIATFAVALCVLDLATRDLHHKYIPGEYLTASILPMPAHIVDIGFSEIICLEASTFEFTIVNPENGNRTSFFRGVWPWSFSDEELGRLEAPC